MKKFILNPEYFRNIIFGLEDGFVSTVGVLFGIATAVQDRQYILIAGVITVLVEATSMGAGAYLSEKSSREISPNKKRSARLVVDGVLMFGSYMLAGVICVLPYVFWKVRTAMVVSVLATLGGLFLIGYFPHRRVRRGVEVLVLAGLAMLIGLGAGQLLKGIL